MARLSKLCENNKWWVKIRIYVNTIQLDKTDIYWFLVSADY